MCWGMPVANGGGMRWLSLLVAIWLGACATSDKGPIVEPQLGSGKADVADRVLDRGTLELGVARTGSFDEDLQFDGYHLEVRAGAVVTIDNTHLGTAARLDSTLFVYGPRGTDGFGASTLAFDDDAGWGKHARLRELRFDQGGEYLVVLGTADAMGRGYYRLEARCDNGACAPAAEPATCDVGLADGIQHCMAEQIADGDLEGDYTASYADALAVCTDGEAMGRIFDDRCAGAGAPAFCALDFESFYQTQVPPCAAELAARSGLCGAYLDEALSLATDGMLYTSESDYPYAVVVWPGQGAPTANSVLALSGLDSTSAVTTTDFDTELGWRARPVDSSMDPVERESVERHRHLRRILEDNLTDTLVVRIGNIQVHVFLVGRTSCGELAGVSTLSIET